MRPTIAIYVIALLLITVIGIGAVRAYGFGVWPAPELEVDDPVIQEWLSSEDVAIRRGGMDKRLEDTTMYIQEGRRIDGTCRFEVRLYGPAGEIRVAQALATNHRTCEQLIFEGTRPP